MYFSPTYNYQSRSLPQKGNSHIGESDRTLVPHLPVSLSWLDQGLSCVTGKDSRLLQ
jgi:hypothetical protein